MSNPQSQSKFCFYASILDAFQSYLDTDNTWEKYYGRSDEPKFTCDEFSDMRFTEFINRINRVPFTNDAVEKGIALNNMVDMLLDNQTDNDQFVISTDEEKQKITIREREIVVDANDNPVETFKNERSFYLPMVNEFVNYYEGALKQHFVLGTLDTCFGDVDLYGYIDYLMPFSYHDMKTTRQYSAGSYKNHWQHLVYPFAGMQCGLDIDRFEYNVTNFKETFTEVYMFKPERDIPKLRNMCEMLIQFLLNNKALITDEKIFNYRKI